MPSVCRFYHLLLTDKRSSFYFEDELSPFPVCVALVSFFLYKFQAASFSALNCIAQLWAFIVPLDKV